MPASRNMPVASYGPKLLAALLAGTLEPQEYSGPYATLVALRLRLNSLRAQMKRESHPQYDQVCKAKVTLTKPDRSGQATLTILPRDAEFDSVLSTVSVAEPDLDAELAALDPTMNPSTLLDEG